MRTIQLPYQRPMVNQMRKIQYGRGGVGSLFSRLASFLRPVLSKAVKVAAPHARQALKDVGREGLQVAANTLSDVVQGKNSKESLKRNLEEGKTNAVKKLKTNVKKGYEAIVDDIKSNQQPTKGSRASASKKKTSNKKVVSRKRKLLSVFD